MTHFGHPSNVEMVKSASMPLKMLSKLSSELVHSLLRTSISWSAPSWYFIYAPLRNKVQGKETVKSKHQAAGIVEKTDIALGTNYLDYDNLSYKSWDAKASSALSLCFIFSGITGLYGIAHWFQTSTCIPAFLLSHLVGVCAGIELPLVNSVQKDFQLTITFWRSFWHPAYQVKLQSKFAKSNCQMLTLKSWTPMQANMKSSNMVTSTMFPMVLTATNTHWTTC